MKNYILTSLIILVSFSACNSHQKEIEEVEGLISLVEETEKTLLSMDTAQVFEAKRKMAIDIAEFNSVTDTLTREEAFKAAEFFGVKKRLFNLTSNYYKYLKEIEVAKTQLNNLKQDLSNNLVSEKDFPNYFRTEKTSVTTLNNEVNKSISGLDALIQKLKDDREEINRLIEQRKQRAQMSNE